MAKKVYILAALYIIYFIVSTIFFSNIFLDEDEAFFLLAGEGLLEGKQLYRDYAEFKTPGTYYFTAFINFMFGNEFIYQRMVIFFINILGSISLFFLARKLFNERVGYLAAALYIIAISLPAFSAYFVLSEQFMLLFVILGFYIFFSSNSRKMLFISGILFGIASIFKQIAVFSFVVIFIIYFSEFLTKDKRDMKSFKEKIINSFFLIVGFLVPIGMVFYYYYSIGLLGDLLYWAYLPLAYFVSLFAPDVIGYNFLILPLVWVFALFFMYKTLRNFSSKIIIQREVFLFFWIILSGVPLLRAQIGHNFLVLLPAASIMAASTILYFYDKHKQGKAKFFVPLLVILILCSVSITAYSGNNLYRNGSGFLKIQKDVSDYIRNNTNPDDKIFTFTYQPSIYYFSERDNPTKYPNIIRPYILNDEQFYQLFDQLKQADTKYIIKAFRCDHFPLFCNEFLIPNYVLETQIGPYEIYRIKV